MDDGRFDALTLALSDAESRRGVLGRLIAVAGILGVAAAPEVVQAKKRKNKHKKHGKKKSKGKKKPRQPDNSLLVNSAALRSARPGSSAATTSGPSAAPGRLVLQHRSRDRLLLPRPESLWAPLGQRQRPLRVLPTGAAVVHRHRAGALLPDRDAFPGDRHHLRRWSMLPGGEVLLQCAHRWHVLRKIRADLH